MRKPVWFSCPWVSAVGLAMFLGGSPSFAALPHFLRLEAEDGAISGATVRDDQNWASGGRCVFIDGTPQSITWEDVVLLPGRYRVSLGCKSPWGTEEAKKRVRVSINDQAIEVGLPNSLYFNSLSLGAFDLPESSRVVVSDVWNWYFIDWIQFSRVEAEDEDRGVTRARRMMDYLVANQRRGGGILSGQQDADEVDYIRQVSGKAPAIIGEDLGEYDSFSAAHGGDAKQATERLIHAWEQGHFVTLSWHWHSPSGWREADGLHWWNSVYANNTDFDLAAALADPQGADYQLLLADIDRIAVELKKLEDANIPVLWRPLHEAEGNQWGAWFWWGASGPEAFKTLWRLLHDRLVGHHQFRHLVWIYSCTDLMQPEWYPGDEYVDIVGVDEYPEDRTTNLKGAWDRMNATFGATGKPIALCECAGAPEVEAMREAGVNWLYFNSWYDENGPSAMDAQRLADLYRSDAMRTVEEIDQNADGVANGVCYLRGLPTQIRLSPEFGLDTGRGIAPVNLGGLLQAPGTERGNLLELDPSGTWVSVGAFFRFSVSPNLADWFIAQPSIVEGGDEGRIRVVFAGGEEPSLFLQCRLIAVP